LINFAITCKPFFDKMKKGVEFVWNDKMEASYELLKQQLALAPILIAPDYKKPFLIQTDASIQGLGALLMQEDEGILKIIMCASRTLRKHEQNYGSTDLEGKGVIFALEKFGHFLEGNRCIIQTDHQPLIQLFKSEDLKGRRFRWKLILSNYDCELKYIQGKTNVLADLLSRLPNDDLDVARMDDRIQKDPRNELEEEELGIAIPLRVVEVKLDELCRAMFGKPEWEVTAHQRTFAKVLGPKLRKENHLGETRWILTDGEEEVICVFNEQQQKEIVNEYHEGVAGGHFAEGKLHRQIRRKYYWPKMREYIGRHVKECQICRAFDKAEESATSKERASIPTPTYPSGHRWGIDLLQLPVTEDGYKYIVIACEYATKWMEAKAIRVGTSYEVARFVYEEICSRHGVPFELVMDNGTEFTGQMNQTLCELLGIRKEFVTPYHPQANGQAESSVKKVLNVLRKKLSKEKQWNEVIPAAMWAIRISTMEATGHSPFELLYGRHDTQPIDALFTGTLGKRLEDNLDWMVKHQRWIEQAGIRTMEQKLRIHQFETDKYSRHYEYQNGDKVWIKNVSRNKLQPRWIGPLQIKHLTEYNTVLLEDEQGNALKRQVSLDRIRPWNPITGDLSDRIGGDMLKDDDVDASSRLEVMMIGGRACELRVMDGNHWWAAHAERNTDHQSEEELEARSTQRTNQAAGSRAELDINQSESIGNRNSEERTNGSEALQRRDTPLTIACEV
jgi:transposase InsO family protein